MDRLFKKIAKVSAWRDTIPSDATSFTAKQLTPGQQLDIDDLRIKFKIERGLTRAPDQADVYVSNLSAASRADLETKPLTVQMMAGYDDAPRLLFIGDLLFGMSEQSGPNWTTLLQVGDGARSYKHSRCRQSYAAGATYRQVITDAARNMGLTLPGNLKSNTALDQKFVTGTVTRGPARNELTRLLAPFGYHWFTQHGQLVVLADDEVVNTSALPVDQDHGMIGTPRFGSPPRSGKPPNVHVKMELYPEMMPGCLVRITSEVVHGGSGTFRVEKVTHEGDTHASQWHTQVEVKPL